MTNNTSTSRMIGISEHTARKQLSRELHARPSEELDAPCEIFLFVKLTGENGHQAEFQQLSEFCDQFHVSPPEHQVKQFSADFGSFRFRWERHSEFISYGAVIDGKSGKPFTGEPPAELIDWLKISGGELLVATHLAIQNEEEDIPGPHCSFTSTSLVTSELGSREGQAWSDLRIHPDGFNRILLHNRSLAPLKMGRVAQRLLEISTYRNMALLALPVAQKIGPRLAEIDAALSDLLAKMRAESGQEHDGKQSIQEEDELLNELSRLSAEIEELSSLTTYRFAASDAYYALVNSRVKEFNEQRVPGYQTIGKFLDRRLSPAMRTCESVAERLENLAVRASRASNLLRTRVDLALERQNHNLLDSMNRRAKLQLRLQETVEGLSIVAITYYFVGLVAYGAKSLKAFGFTLNADVVAGAAIIPIVLIVGFGVKRIRKSINAKE